MEKWVEMLLWEVSDHHVSVETLEGSPANNARKEKHR
jgi:hypothetical protein